MEAEHARQRALADAGLVDDWTVLSPLRVTADGRPMLMLCTYTPLSMMPQWGRNPTVPR